MKRRSTLKPFIIKRGDIGGQDTKECPFCGEEIKAMVTICHFCHGKLNGQSKDNKGQFVRIRFKAGDKTYVGDVFLPENFRVSDLISENKRFIVLVNAVEEAPTRDLPIGFLALNKTMIKWVELETVKEEAHSDSRARVICRAP
jgi:hypothetical protein